jgi:hypothetical protein
MGYTGSSVLADVLDGSLGSMEEEPGPVEAAGMLWTDEAREELAQTPPFLQGRTRRRAEERARELGSTEVTREIFLGSRR